LTTRANHSHLQQSPSPKVETDLVQFLTNWAGCFGTPPFSFLELLEKNAKCPNERAKGDNATEYIVDSGVSFNAYESDLNLVVEFGELAIDFVVEFGELAINLGVEFGELTVNLGVESEKYPINSSIYTLCGGSHGMQRGRPIPTRVGGFK
jgi:hypothetical protein